MEENALKIKPYIRKISRETLIMPCIIFAISLFLFMLVFLNGYLSINSYQGLKGAANAHALKEHYINISFDKLYYSGYDFSRNNKTTASFYYAYDEDCDSYFFILLPFEKTQNSSAILYDVSVDGIICEADSLYDSFLESFSGSAKVNLTALTYASADFYIDGHVYWPLILQIASYILAFLVFINFVKIVWSILVIAFPSLHKSARKLARFGLSSSDFNEIDREITEEYIINTENVFISEHYIVSFMKRSIVILPLFNVVWTYKYSSWNSKWAKRKKLKYNLVMMTYPKIRFEIHGLSKKAADEILHFFKNDFVHIKVGYSEEIRKEIKSILG